MTLKQLKSSFYSVALALTLIACGSTNIVSTPIENIDSVTPKTTDLTKAEKQNWGHADLMNDTIPGISLDRAYAELIGSKKGKKVIVAVIDSGMDLTHEDLDDVIWVNKGEVANNGKDDDNNGYIDDVHGYNFLGESYNEQLEYVRMIKFNIGDENTLSEARTTRDKKYLEATQNKEQYEQILTLVKQADLNIKEHLGKTEYTSAEVAEISSSDPRLMQSVSILNQMFDIADTIPEVIQELKDGLVHFSDQINYHLNVEFDGREVVGDNAYNFNDRGYGNGDPQNRVDTESHGTHVAGIIAAERNNKIGMDGVANNVEIMSIRAVPNGDEYDKDIALGIRYAVDNGAKVINGSFGKGYSPNAEWVHEAIQYAAENDVLFVHGAGNDGLDLDDPANPGFPNDQLTFNSAEIGDNFINVGALTMDYGSEMVASYSNYGKIKVDVFAPGSDIYSTMPNNKYKFNSGTSMASPMVAGLAALIRSYYPKLSASDVKQILMQSGLSSKANVILDGDSNKARSFDEISKSGKMVNAYNALILADKKSKNL
ncbi:S8 family peptidase [Eudoraea chungangensis]|uniref:S8 family peptidase n=1 Tax=Eudoraea chungangensis TaxID=1481905 RepID=UPI0023EDC0FD|nr:S8 family peptidase [Eudoraea chungangensis]